MEYKEKLTQFNSTDKYREEMEFMINIIDPERNDNILDYGCGTGAMVKHILNDFENLKCFGFDVQNLRTGDDAKDEYTFKDSFHFQMNKIYFMHSIAHIPDVDIVLKDLHNTFLAESGVISVLTPNRAYIELCDNQDYKPDPTVVNHFDKYDLMKLFYKNGYDIELIGEIGHRIGEFQERIYLKARKVWTA